MNEIVKEFSKLFNEGKNEYIYDFELLDFFRDNIFIKGKPNNKLKPLYRYSPADYYNIRSLETKKIHLSEIGQMNDVFEGLSCEINDNELNSIDKLYDLAYIKSFSEICNDLSMWSRYADEYSGMCVEYDVRKLDENVLCHLYPVNYSDERFVKSDLHFTFNELIRMKQDRENGNCLDSCDFLENIMALFLSKSKVWEYEKEWRLVFSYLQLNADYEKVENERNSDEKILYEYDTKDIDFDCATKIYLGPKMEKIKKEHLKEIGRELKIDVIELQLSKNKYELVPKEEKQCQK